MVSASAHKVGPWGFPVEDYARGGLPRITSTAATWSSESCSDHPDASRVTMEMFMPSLLWSTAAPTVGDDLRLFVLADGLDGEGGVRPHNVAYFEGWVDGVERKPRRGKAFHAVPNKVVQSFASSGTPVVEIPYPGAPLTIVNPSADTVSVHVLVEADVRRTGATSSATHTGLYAGESLAVYTMPELDNGAGALTSRLSLRYDSTQYHALSVRPTGEKLFAWLHVYGVEPGRTVRYHVPFCEKHRGLPEGYDVRVVGSDAIAVLGRQMLADSPWGYDDIAMRVYGRINPLIAKSGIYCDAYPIRYGYEEPNAESLSTANYVRPLDVDNRSALDVYRQTVAATGRVAVGLAGRCGFSLKLDPLNTLDIPASGQASLLPNRRRVAEIDSSAIRATSEHITVDKVVTRMAASWWVPKEDATDYSDPSQMEERTFYLDALSKTTYGIVARKIETHQYTTRRDWVLPQIATSLHNQMITALEAQSEPQWYFNDDMRLIPRDLDSVRGLAQLVDNSTRFAYPIRVVGPTTTVDTPREHRCKGGRFGFDGGEWRLELSVEPASYAGQNPATFEVVKGYPTLTLDKMRNITFDDMKGVYL